MVKCAGFCEEESEGTMRCAGCSPTVVYCSKACQIAHWPTHIFVTVCYQYRGKTVPTAYHLRRACFRDLLPTDKQTLEDYGFNRAFTPANQSMLLGLYQGLFTCYEIPPKAVHTWRRDGILIQEIRRVYEEVPSQFGGGSYYPWFLEHQDLLDPSLKSSTKVAEDFILEATMRAWRHIGGRPLSNGTAVSDINIERAVTARVWRHIGGRPLSIGTAVSEINIERATWADS
jgi:hypothetical protein